MYVSASNHTGGGAISPLWIVYTCALEGEISACAAMIPTTSTMPTMASGGDHTTIRQYVRSELGATAQNASNALTP